MKLAGWDEGPGTGRGEAAFGGLEINSGGLQALGRQTGTLAGHAQGALTDLASSHSGLEGRTRGFASTSGLTAVRMSWEGRLQDLRKECVRVQQAFKSAAAAVDSTEESNRTSMSGIGAAGDGRRSRIAGLS